MPNIVNGLGQVKVGVKPTPPPPPSTLMSSIYSAYNADSQGLTSLKTSLYAVYNGESNANDSFGSNNGTAVGGLTYTTGKIGNAFNFNGTNAYVSLPNNSLNFTGDFSISFWAYYNSTSASYELFVSNYNNPSGANYGFNIYTDPSNILCFDLYGGSLQSYLHTPFIPVANTWYMFTITRKRSTETKVYINGVNQPAAFYPPGSQGATFNQTYDSNQIVNLGSYLNGNLLSNIRMDAVNFWQKVLTQSEITELYNSGNGAQYITNDFYKPTTNDALNTYNGTAQGGLTYGVGKVGTAFQFNGTNAYVNVGDVMDVGTSSWTYSMWFNVNSISSTRILFSKTISAESAGRVRGNVTTGGLIRFAFSPTTTASTDDIDIQSTDTISLNTWYHVVFVLDRTNNLRIYLNGVLQTVTVMVAANNLIPYSALNFNNTRPFRIGAGTAADNSSPNSLFSGSIDAFNVWNKVLTQSEITELYNSGNGKQYPF